jgi:uncharacterized membrane protein YhaH (DUF805 family)
MSKPLTEDLFSFSGRRNRKSYIFSLLILWTIFVPLLALRAALPAPLGLVIVGLIWLPLAVSSFAIGSQRCRDFGWTGWAFLLLFIPVISLIFVLALMFIPGTKGPNQYGPDPLSAPVPQPHNAPTAKSESYLRPDNNAHPSFQSQPSAPPRIYAPPPAPTASYPAPPAPAAQFSHSASDEDIYEMIAKEIADGSVKAGLWMRLFAEASGDENRTKALYIARRAEMLMAERQSARDREAARIDETRRRDAERREKESARQNFLLQSFDFLKAPYGTVVILKDNSFSGREPLSIFLVHEGKVTKYSSAGALRDERKDNETWWPVTDNKEKLRTVRLIAEHIPKQ